MQSPIGLVPKAENQTRLIFHLSYNFTKTNNLSINACTQRHFCTVKYNNLDHAVENSLRLIKSMLGKKTQIWYCKMDIKSAFRVLPLKPGVYWLLVMSAEHPVTGKWYFFIDKCLPFGHSISCALFQEVLDAVVFIFKYEVRRHVENTHLWVALTNYLDDFLFAALSRIRANGLMQQFLLLCSQIGLPVALEKTEWAVTVIIFLGVLLDSSRHMLGIPEDKRLRALNSLLGLIDRKKASVKELQSITGLLNFLNRAIHPGKVFTRRMYAKFSQIEEKKLKPHHHIRLNAEFKEDCKVWVKFLSTGGSMTNRPFVDLHAMEFADTLDFYMDAAKGKDLGFGGVFQQRWLFGQWKPGFIERFDPSIEYLELFGVFAAVYTWSESLRNWRIILFCDNQAVVSMINTSSTKCKHCMVLIRLLTLRSLIYNMRIFTKWFRGLSNRRADLLSHQKIWKFLGVNSEFK